MNTRPIEEAVQFAKEVSPELKNIEKNGRPNSVLNFKFNVATAFFVSGDFKSASDRYRKISNRKGLIRNDLKGVSRVLLTLSEFHKDDSEYTLSLNNAARRFYRKHDELDKMDGIVFRMIDQLLNEPEHDRSIVLKATLTKVDTLMKKNSSVIGLEEVQVWLRSRLSGRSIKQVWDTRNT